VVKELPAKDAISSRMKRESIAWRSAAGIPVQHHGDFGRNLPVLSRYEERNFISLESALLREMIDKTIFAFPSDESRYNLTGVSSLEGKGSGKNTAHGGHGRVSSIADRSAAKDGLRVGEWHPSAQERAE